MAIEFVESRAIPLAKLTRFPGNARRGDVDAIYGSLRRQGQYRSLVVRQQGRKLIILAGNHTSMALGKHPIGKCDLADHEKHPCGLCSGPGDGFDGTARCEVIKCTDDEATRINLGDNRLAELGGYDDDALRELLVSLEDDFDGTGWTADDLLKLDEPLPEPGDAPTEELANTWGVIIVCATEDDQVELLERFNAEGFNVRAVMA